jgi:trehalose synthase
MAPGTIGELMDAMREIPVVPLPPERFREVLGDRYRELEPDVSRARELLAGRVLWHVNSTARGGGVAEMLRSHLAYVRGAGIDVRWVVIAGDPSFFEVTKRIHNNLHEDGGDAGPLGDRERQLYETALAAPAGELGKLIRSGDIVFLHDPQTAGLVEAVRATGALAVWRCHVGVDHPNGIARAAWEFLRPYVEQADACVFSRRQFVWEDLRADSVWIAPPSIDAFSPKNQDLDPVTVGAILGVLGIADPPPHGAPTFSRYDGTPQRVNRDAVLVQQGPLPADAPVVAQVSRWDRLKDPVGVLKCFARHVTAPAAHLILAGPDVEAVDDDPEGAAVLAEVRNRLDSQPARVRDRVHLVSLPMIDLDENAAMVNALQRRANVVVQKSLAEGFGLTVAEAMWKARPVVATRVGGIQDQIVDGESGVLVEDPRDLAAAGAAIDGLLDDPGRAARMGQAARERVTDRFLALGRLIDYFRNVAALIARD